MNYVIPPDGVCLWGHCDQPRAHVGTHFCALHESHDGTESR